MSSANPGNPDERTIADLGEFGLIASMTARMPGSPRVLVGPGDDAAVLAAPDGRVVATTDFLIEGRHFRRDWSTPEEVGHRAAVRSLADVAAMGATPTALLVAFAAPPDLPARWAVDMATGLAAEATRAGAAVAGGDVAQAETVILTVTGIGDLGGRAPVTRAGARPGDLLAVAGPLGWSAAGLALLAAGAREPATLVAAHRRPTPTYGAGPDAAAAGATAMIDVSDGLLADLGHLAAASDVLVDVELGLLRVDAALLAAAAVVGTEPARREAVGDTPGWTATPGAGRRGQDRPVDARRVALHWMVTGGEDHSLVATFPPEAVLPPGWSVIGHVRSGRGVTVDGTPPVGPGGWEHFRDPR